MIEVAPRDLASPEASEIVRSGLAALARALRSRNSCSDLIAAMERSFGDTLDGARVEIAPPGTHCTGDAEGKATAIDLQLDEECFGRLLVRSRDPLRSDVREALQLLAVPLAAAISHRRTGERRGLARAPDVDALCGIPNRLAFDERFRTMWETCALQAMPLVVAIFDVDFFKAYNDVYGHVGGDRCLQSVAQLLAERAAGTRFCARYGGEEFVMLFMGSTLDEVADEVGEIVERLATSNYPHSGTTLGRVSVSVGIAAAMPVAGDMPLELISEADRRLFRAKRLGRNRICSGATVSDGAFVARRSGRSVAMPTPDGRTFGRDDDVARIIAALRHSRMVTLVGPSGIGKSRLLTLLCESPMCRLDRTVVFVESELLRDGTDPANALAAAFDLSVAEDGALVAVTEYLAERDALLIFDQGDVVDDGLQRFCAHLIARTAAVSIASAGRAIGVQGERAIVVAPLDEGDALDLLAERCGVGRTTYAEIAPYLGGNPAIIELASACIGRTGYVPLRERLARDGTRYTSLEAFRALLADLER